MQYEYHYNGACSPAAIYNLFCCGHHNLVPSGATVMALSIHVFVQVALWFCVVTTCMGGITDFEKKISQLENKVKDSQEEMKLLHQIIQQLEKRLQILEVNGEFGKVRIQPAPVGPTLHAY